MMKRLRILILCIGCCSYTMAQVSTGKISYTISNGLQLAGVDGTNPVIYDNDIISDTPEVYFLWLKANRKEINLVGNISTRDMWGQHAKPPYYLFTHEKTWLQWGEWYNAATQSGLKNIPAPVMGASLALKRPSDGDISKTVGTPTAGSNLIVTEARKASRSKPLIVILGGNASTVANAYLQDNSIADKVVVFQILGYERYNVVTSYNNMDAWSTYIVMKKFTYVNWNGDINTRYNTVKPIPATVDLTGMPSNSFSQLLINNWKNGYWAAYHEIGDAPVTLYLADHSLFMNVIRKLENQSTTTSDTYDYLLVSQNKWDSYWPLLRTYLTNPDNWIPNNTANTSPTVSITSPGNNTSFSAGSNITISAIAADADGMVSKVEFYRGTTKLGEDLTSPYSYVWTNVQAGSYSLTAKATDNQNAVKSSSVVSITVANSNAPPTVTITAPSNNASFSAGDNMTIVAAAADTDGTITKVEFYNGTVKLGEDVTSPYNYVWTNVPEGTYTLTARSTDNQNAIGTSSAVKVTVVKGNVSPTVALTGPSNNALFPAGGNMTIAANASDADGTVSKVEFYSGATKLGEDVTSPYAYVWSNVPVGSYSLTARATDNLNAVGTSSAIGVTVTISNVPPTISITAPSNNALFSTGSNLSITANATDNDGTVSKVEFYRGNVKLGEDVSRPYTYVWNNVPAGSYSLTARATDNQNAVTTSSAISITVANSNGPPTVTLTAPVNNALFSTGSNVTITATATDADGSISRVEFYSGATKLGEDLTSPYSYVWTNVPTGSYSLTAKATDNQNAVANSQAVEISVTVATPPTISAGPDVVLELPSNTVILKGKGTSADGSLLSFKWMQLAGPNQATLSNPGLPEITMTNLIEGEYLFGLTGTDTKGLSNTDEVKITVGAYLISQSLIPRFFTPNDDGINDFWEWSKSEHLESSILMIFNRFGQKIYEAFPYENTWDGKVKGVPLEEDAYYYVIRLLNRADIKGAVRIIR